MRGGGFNDPATPTRAAFRYHATPHFVSTIVGVRPARRIEK
jgi:hypothetical protein